MRIVLTGSASHLAKSLLPALCAHVDISAVTGIDVSTVGFSHVKFRHHRLDIRAPETEAMIAGHDAIIHLAFVVLRGRMREAEMRDINVNGTERLFSLARELGITKRIHLSSASVYGSGERLTECAPLAPVRGFVYAEHKAELERWFEAHDLNAIRLRPHVILGPHAQPLLKTLMRQPFYLRLPAPQPRFQCVHEQDVVAAILAALFRNAAGPFNLASNDSLSLREAILQRNARAVGMPRWAAKAALAAAWRISGWGGEPGWIDAARHPLNLDTQRARQMLGWRPRYTAHETLATL